MTPSVFISFILMMLSFTSFVYGAPMISSPPPHRMTNRLSDSWTDEPLCVLKMGSSCPRGFTESQIRLSVPTDVNPRDTAQDGELLIITTPVKNSGTWLNRSKYDALYTLATTTCCK